MFAKSFPMKTLAFAVMAVGSVSAHAAALDRSGQEITAFLQDGTYAEASYTLIDANVSGKDTSGNEIGDIAKRYDFFRGGVKTDVNDRWSVGVIYDQPFGALVDYQGTNNFTGAANGVATAVIDRVTSLERQEQLTNQAVDLTQKALTAMNSGNVNEGLAYVNMAGLLGGTQQLLERVRTRLENGETPTQIAEYLTTVLPVSASVAASTVADIQTHLASGNVSATAAAEITQNLQAYLASATALRQAPQALSAISSDRGRTNVEVHTHNLTGLIGYKFGQNKNVQVYGGAALQHLTGEIHLRGNAYATATGYDAKIKSDTAPGWVAGMAYYKPEIALKAALTYRSKIKHTTPMTEYLPLAALNALPSDQTAMFTVETPESWNLDLQSGLSAKHKILGTLKVRYVPWSDFAVTPPLYHEASKGTVASGLNLVDYSKDQWSADLGIAKQINDKFVVQGSLGWDSGAGNPTSTLGPIKGYYSFGLGARYNITPQWSVSGGAKYLRFGDATSQLPDHIRQVGYFADNDGYAVGVKFAYHQK